MNSHKIKTALINIFILTAEKHLTHCLGFTSRTLWFCSSLITSTASRGFLAQTIKTLPFELMVECMSVPGLFPPQLSGRSRSGQLASVFQTEAGAHGAGRHTDCETEPEGGQSPLLHRHPPSEAGTGSSSSSWETDVCKLLRCLFGFYFSASSSTGI